MGFAAAGAASDHSRCAGSGPLMTSRIPAGSKPQEIALAIVVAAHQAKPGIVKGPDRESWRTLIWIFINE